MPDLVQSRLQVSSIFEDESYVILCQSLDHLIKQLFKKDLNVVSSAYWLGLQGTRVWKVGRSADLHCSKVFLADAQSTGSTGHPVESRFLLWTRL